MSGTFPGLDVPMLASHREELYRRLENYEKNPGRLLTLEDLQRRLKANGGLILVHSRLPCFYCNIFTDMISYCNEMGRITETGCG